jgi:hypothetical protein
MTTIEMQLHADRTKTGARIKAKAGISQLLHVAGKLQVVGMRTARVRPPRSNRNQTALRRPQPPGTHEQTHLLRT